MDLGHEAKLASPFSCNVNANGTTLRPWVGWAWSWVPNDYPKATTVS